MKITYKNVRKIRLILLSLGTAVLLAGLLLPGSHPDEPGLFPLIAAFSGITLVLAGAVIYFIYWRCPHCKVLFKTRYFAFSPQPAPVLCEYCGQKLEE